MNSNTFSIEQTLLASVLNSEIECNLDANIFTAPFHKKLILGINRLKQLYIYVDFETLRNKFATAKKWTIQEDIALIEIMKKTPFGSKKSFDSYYNILEKAYLNSFDKRLAI